REREFDNLVQGTISVGEYARRFSYLLSYVPHVSGRERVKRNRFLEGLNKYLYSLVLASSPTSYADAVDKAMDIEEGLRNRRSRVQPQAAQGSRPNAPGVQPPQFPQSSQ
ncbi:DNA/RNA polymerase superfamily protein, partial [Dorcoceras hygrometricum]